ncbi:hypothetical protein B0T16DRAFT_67719 [Cercophora newfieldiana]|uniref:Secreted protein n=1 Tax=Cercophora newfieldiana TaxID=92897 RepID=A0AA39YT56_9PEZI|nr:hypothetical protein B0T16DRAFT_67719 [Cercophora newfieldiana]
MGSMRVAWTLLTACITMARQLLCRAPEVRQPHAGRAGTDTDNPYPLTHLVFDLTSVVFESEDTQQRRRFRLHA